LDRTAVVCSTIDSSDITQLILAKEHCPRDAKNVGEPKAPRLTAIRGVFDQLFLTSSCCARAISLSMSMPDEMESVPGRFRDHPSSWAHPHVMIGGAEIGPRTYSLN